MKSENIETGDTSQLVTFILGKETYGIDIFKVQEVLHFQGVTAIPNSPDFVEGVINLRDKVIPVVDLKKRLGVSRESGSKQRIVVLDLDDHSLGVIVDDISKVLTIGTNLYESLPDTVIGDRDKACIARLAKTEDGLVIIITPERILTNIEMNRLSSFKESLEQEEQLDVTDRDGVA